MGPDGLDRCIRDEEWSLILRPGAEPDELYHLQQDPGETQNVIGWHPEAASRLAAAFGPVYANVGRPVRGVQGAYEVADSPVT